MEIRYFKVFNRWKGVERFMGIYGLSFVLSVIFVCALNVIIYCSKINAIISFI